MPRQTNLPLEVIFARQGRGNLFGTWGLGLLEPGVWSLKLRQGRGVWLWNSFSLVRAEGTRLEPGAWSVELGAWGLNVTRADDPGSGIHFRLAGPGEFAWSLGPGASKAWGLEPETSPGPRNLALELLFAR